VLFVKSRSTVSCSPLSPIPTPSPTLQSRCRTCRPSAPHVNRRAAIREASRRYLRKRGIACTISEKKEQVAKRKKKGSAAGRAPALDMETYKQRLAVECGISCPANGEWSLATAPCAWCVRNLGSTT
jgi:hypothetical protein